MKTYRIAKRQQEKCFYRLHRSRYLPIRGGLGLGRLKPGHRLYRDYGTQDIGVSFFVGYEAYPPNGYWDGRYGYPLGEPIRYDVT